MTHTRKLDDDEGDFGGWQDAGGPGCMQLVAVEGSRLPQLPRRCGAKVQVRTWESHDGGYEDYQYRCASGHVWWIDGIDS